MTRLIKLNRVLLAATLIISISTAYAQNYLNNGGFELYKSNVDTYSSCGNAGMPNDCPPTNNSLSYYSNCRGGYASVNKELENWVDRGGTPHFLSNCTFCAPHSPDWIYNGFYHGAIGFFTTQFGSSCVGAAPFELFQQNMPIHINKAGNYILSGWLKSSSPNPSIGGWRFSTYDIQFIMSKNQPKYNDESCDNPTNPSADYMILNNKDLVRHVTLDSAQPITDWTFVEFPITLTGTPDFKWLSVNVDANGAESNPPYVAFDEIYISDEQCYCPLVRYYTDAAITTGTTHIGAQEYLYVASNVSVANGANALFTAGKAVTVNPGFVVQAGGVAEIKLGGCFDNTPESAFYIPNPYSSCWFQGQQLCIYTKNITVFSIKIFTLLGQYIAADFSGQVNTAVVNGNGYNVTCIDLNFPVENQYVGVNFQGIGCNGGSKEWSGSVLIDCGLGRPNNPTDNPPTHHSVNIYPGPFCSSVTVENLMFDIGDKIILTDANGKIISQTDVSSSNVSLNTEHITEGLYFVNYKGRNTSAVQKIVKTCD